MAVEGGAGDMATLLPSTTIDGDTVNATALYAGHAGNDTGAAALVPEDDSPYYDLVKHIYIYYVPLIIIIGLLGNSLSICVLFSTNLKSLSSSYYLSSLAASDSLFLVSLTFQWLSTSKVAAWMHVEGVCQLVNYAIYLTGFLSPWLVVAFTVERFIAVCHPLRRPSMCTVGRAKWVISVLTLGTALYHVWVLVVFGVRSFYPGGPRHCDLLPKYQEHFSILNHIDTFTTLVIPFLVIIVMNITIARKVYLFYRTEALYEGQHEMSMRGRDYCAVCAPAKQDPQHALPLTHTAAPSHPLPLANGHISGRDAKRDSADDNSYQPMMPAQCDDAQGQAARAAQKQCQCRRSTSSGGGSHQASSLRNKTQINITKMLLIVSTVFILLNLPAHVTRMYLWVRMQSTDDLMDLNTDQFAAAVQFFNLLYNTNFSINFFLYMISGANFRRALRGMTAGWLRQVKWRKLVPGGVCAFGRGYRSYTSPTTSPSRRRTAPRQASPPHHAGNGSHPRPPPPAQQHYRHCHQDQAPSGTTRL